MLTNVITLTQAPKPLIERVLGLINYLNSIEKYKPHNVKL